MTDRLDGATTPPATTLIRFSAPAANAAAVPAEPPATQAQAERTSSGISRGALGGTIGDAVSCAAAGDATTAQAPNAAASAKFLLPTLQRLFKLITGSSKQKFKFKVIHLRCKCRRATFGNLTELILLQ